VFINEENEELEFSIFLCQCLLEAQTAKYLSSPLVTSSTTAYIRLINPVALDAYAVGYCIANFHIGVSWNVELNDYGYSFKCGLSTNVPSVGVINRLDMKGTCAFIPDFSHLIGTTSLKFSGYLPNTNVVHLSKLIPHLTSLKKLSIIFHGRDQQDGLLKILQQLYRYSNVTSLDIICDRKQYLKQHEHILALIHPSSGILEHLGVGSRSLDITNEDELVDLLSAPSSLKSLHLLTQNIPSHAVYLKTNTNLTTLKLDSDITYVPEDQIPALIDVVNCNRTLKVLVLRHFYLTADSKGWINPLRSLVSTLHNNNTLQRIDILVYVYRVYSDGLTFDSSDDVTHFLTACHEELTLDSRVTWM
jgi:hypothetical protein